MVIYLLFFEFLGSFPVFQTLSIQHFATAREPRIGTASGMIPCFLLINKVVPCFKEDLVQKNVVKLTTQDGFFSKMITFYKIYYYFN